MCSFLVARCSFSIFIFWMIIISKVENGSICLRSSFNTHHWKKKKKHQHFLGRGAALCLLCESTACSWTEMWLNVLISATVKSARLSIVLRSESLGCFSDRVPVFFAELSRRAAAAVQAGRARIRSLSLALVQPHLCADSSSFYQPGMSAGRAHCGRASPLESQRVRSWYLWLEMPRWKAHTFL